MSLPNTVSATHRSMLAELARATAVRATLDFASIRHPANYFRSANDFRSDNRQELLAELSQATASRAAAPLGAAPSHEQIDLDESRRAVIEELSRNFTTRERLNSYRTSRRVAGLQEMLSEVSRVTAQLRAQLDETSTHETIAGMDQLVTETIESHSVPVLSTTDLEQSTTDFERQRLNEELSRFLTMRSSALWNGENTTNMISSIARHQYLMERIRGEQREQRNPKENSDRTEQKRRSRGKTFDSFGMASLSTPLQTFLSKWWSIRRFGIHEKTGKCANTFFTELQGIVADFPSALTSRGNRRCTPLHFVLSSSPPPFLSSPSDQLQLIKTLCCDREHVENGELPTPSQIAGITTSGLLPLHQASLSHSVPLHIVQYLFHVFPAAVTSPTRDSGKLPLHLAATSKRPAQQALSIVRFLYKQNPQAAKTRTCDGLTPFHCAVRANADEDVALFLLAQYPEAAKIKGLGYGFTPLHSAARCGASEKLIEALISHFPQAAAMKTCGENNLPLHLVFSRQRRDEKGCSTKSIQTIFAAYPPAATTVNANGKIPLHIGLGKPVSDDDTWEQLRLGLSFLIQACPQCVTVPDGTTLPLMKAALCSSPVLTRSMIEAAYFHADSSVVANDFDFLARSDVLNEQTLPCDKSQQSESMRELLRFYPDSLYRQVNLGCGGFERATSSLERFFRERFMWQPIREEEPDVDSGRSSATASSHSLIAKFRMCYNDYALERFFRELYGASFAIERGCESVNETTTFTKGAKESKSRQGWTPMHRAAYHSSFGYEVSLAVRYFHERFPDDTCKADSCGRLPLHVAVERNPQAGRLRCSGALVDLLMRCYPKAMEVRDNSGHRPLEISLMVTTEKGEDCKNDPSQSGLEASYVLLRSMPSALLAWCWTG